MKTTQIFQRTQKQLTNYLPLNSALNAVLGNSTTQQTKIKIEDFCPKTLDGECDEYDGWEPSKKCLVNNGLNCKRVKA